MKENMIIVLIEEFIKDLENTELVEENENKVFQKDKLELIDALEAYISSIR